MVAVALTFGEPCRVSEDPNIAPALVVPLGTRIVTRVEVRAETERAHRPVGSVAEIIGLPADALHRYRIRFSDGGEAGVRRRDFTELIARKTTGAEKGVLPEGNLSFHAAEYRRLVDLLEQSAEASALPEAPSARPDLHDLLVRIRLRGLTRS
jgi:hypothetical protein